MLIHKFDPQLSIQIVGAYLDLMNIDGWIPREIVLGAEAEARIPGSFLVQEDWVANPPMFFYLMRDMIHDSEVYRKLGNICFKILFNLNKGKIKKYGLI